MAKISDWVDGAGGDTGAQIKTKIREGIVDVETDGTITGDGNVATPLVVSKTGLALENVDNTSDANKPVSTAQQTALNLKADIDGSNLTNATVNAVTLKNSDPATSFLNGEGNYTTPAGGGDVAGPASAVDNNFAAFDGITGKIIKDSLAKTSDFATSAQGTLADSATQPLDNISTLTNDSNFIDSAGAPVQSVNTKTGAAVLDADDISDTATTNKYTTAGDISKLAGIEALAEVNTVNSIPVIVGADAVLNMVSLTDAEYTGGSKVATTLYLITDA